MDPQISEDALAEYWFMLREQAWRELVAAFKHAKNNGLTEKELAVRIGESEAFVYRCLRGRENISLRTVNELARAMGLRMEVRFVDLGDIEQASIC